MLKFFSVLFLVLLCLGCSSGGAVRPDAGYTSATPVESLDISSMGDSITLDGVVYSVVKEYFAASGKSCKLLQSGGSGDLRAACPSAQSGRWYVRKALETDSARIPKALTQERVSTQLPSPAKVAAPAEQFSSSIVESTSTVAPSEATTQLSAVPYSTPLKVAEPIAVDLNDVDSRESVAVRPGETLWKFARRVTGNALNWSLIADHNNISDVTTVREGDLLSIPEELSLVGEGG